MPSWDGAMSCCHTSPNNADKGQMTPPAEPMRKCLILDEAAAAWCEVTNGELQLSLI